MKTVKCSKCPKTFTKPTQMLAEAALRMHVGRKHERNIIANHEHSGVIRRRANGSAEAVVVADKHPRSHLTHAEVGSIVGFIRERRDQFPNKTACFTAALESAGVRDRISNNSTAVNRYFAKAETETTAAPATPQKRKYTRRQPVVVQQEIHVNFCPNCGCNIHAVARGIAAANLQHA
jgi:hypothetical protein